MKTANRQDKAIDGFGPQKKPPRNKYASACAILASMSAILIGYGKTLRSMRLKLLIFQTCMFDYKGYCV